MSDHLDESALSWQSMQLANHQSASYRCILRHTEIFSYCDGTVLNDGVHQRNVDAYGSSSTDSSSSYPYHSDILPIKCFISIRTGLRSLMLNSALVTIRNSIAEEDILFQQIDFSKRIVKRQHAGNLIYRINPLLEFREHGPRQEKMVQDNLGRNYEYPAVTDH
jgi:hypothetical protein